MPPLPGDADPAAICAAHGCLHANIAGIRRLLPGFASCLAMSEMRGSYLAQARGSLLIALQAS